jgi:hypothetical protein
MHADKNTIGFNEIPLDIPVFALSPGGNYMNIHTADKMVRAGPILIATGLPDYSCHLMQRNLSRCEPVFDVDARSLLVRYSASF